MHYLKNYGMKDPIEELSFFNLHGLKYLGTNEISWYQLSYQVAILCDFSHHTIIMITHFISIIMLSVN